MGKRGWIVRSSEASIWRRKAVMVMARRRRRS